MVSGRRPRVGSRRRGARDALWRPSRPRPGCSRRRSRAELLAALPVAPGAAGRALGGSRLTPPIAAPDAEAHRLALALPDADTLPGREALRARAIGAEVAALAEVGAAAAARLPLGPRADGRDDRAAHDRGGVRGGRRRGRRAARASPTSSATCSSSPCSWPSSSRSEGAADLAARGARPGGQARRRATPTSTATRSPARPSRVVDMWERRKREERGRPGDLPRPARRAARPRLRHQGPEARGGGRLRLPRTSTRRWPSCDEETAELREDPGARELGDVLFAAVARGAGGGRRSRARPARLGAALPRARGAARSGSRPRPASRLRDACPRRAAALVRGIARTGRRHDRPHRGVGGPGAPRRGGARRAPARPLRGRPGPRRGARRWTSATCTSTTRRTGSPARRSPCSWRWRGARRACRGASRRCSRGERINVTEGRPVLHVALRAPRDAVIEVDGHNVVPDVHEVLDRMADLADRVRSGAWTGATGERIRAVVNIGIGGLGPRPRDGLPRARATTPIPAIAVRFVSNVDGDDVLRRRRRPATRPLHAVHRLVQDLHDAGDADQRAQRAGLAAERPRALRRRRRAGTTSWPSRPTPSRSRRSASTPPTCSASGTGWAAATRSTRPSACRWPSRSGPSASASSSPASALMDEHFRTTPIERNMPGPARAARDLERQLPGRRDPRGAALQRAARALPGLPPAARHGEQRQVGGPPRAPRRDRPPGPIVWGEPGTNGQHAFYQLIHQGTRLVPGDLIGFCRPTRRGGRAPGPADGQPPRPGRGARLRQDRRRRSPPRACAPALVPAPDLPGQPADQRRSSRRELTPSVLGQLIALYEHKVFTQGVDLGHQLLRPVGRRARQGARIAHRPRADVGRGRPTCATTARPTP